MSQYCGRTLKLVTQSRRGRSAMRATLVAPQNARPEALRDLYLDAGTRIRRGSVAPSPTRASK
ncbi:hypothetical protein LWC34_23445 [Kibdelosporangium philippinense]|uniref:Uncharacterized protein n=2 Tax=Kibdelosporangium TaxID=2029 RepID=A0A1W2CXS6_KIBAR|nr:hypothetical protein [Kibdelosporangium philippinense]MCE7005759.1 hypothetical protein [Kibdelosporangium philippinense]SMC89694.1 hypothetical protein SAMN05661093_02584 [Kibdelosporangium aridum]